MVNNEQEVHGITADLAQELHQQQWVNVYQLDPALGTQKIHYCGKCQVKNLFYVFHDHPPKQFALEPLDHQGKVISVQQAFDNAARGEV